MERTPTSRGLGNPEAAVMEAVWGPLRPRRRRRARDTPLSVGGICEVALALVDREGMDALSMRRLAVELDASPSALYWHLHSKEELLDRIRDLISGEMRLVELDVEQPWRAAATDGARRIRSAMLAHPRAAPIVAARPAIGPNGVLGMERLLGTFVRGGFGPDTIGPAYTTFIAYTMGVTMRECLFGEQARTAAQPKRQPFADLLTAHLAPESFPNLTGLSHAVFSGSGSWDDQFEFGLDRLLVSLEMLRDAAPAGTPPAATDESPAPPGAP